MRTRAHTHTLFLQERMATVTSVMDEDKSKNYFRGKSCVYQKTETGNKLSRKGKIKFISGSFYDSLV